MSGRPDDEILADIDNAFQKIPKIFPNKDNLIVTHNFSSVRPENAGRLYYLGSAIQTMDECDAVYFCKGWEKAKGCQVEHYICELYGIQRIEE